VPYNNSLERTQRGVMSFAGANAVPPCRAAQLNFRPKAMEIS